MGKSLRYRAFALCTTNDINRLFSIFKWFEEDFETKGGVRTFIAPYSPESLQASVKNDKLTVYYLDYDWDLNEL